MKIKHFSISRTRDLGKNILEKLKENADDKHLLKAFMVLTLIEDEVYKENSSLQRP